MVSHRLAHLILLFPAMAMGAGGGAQPPPGAGPVRPPPGAGPVRPATEVPDGPKRPERVRGHEREIGGRAYCAVMPGFTPRRFGAGQSGRLSIVLALQSKAVLDPASEFTLTYGASQGPVQLGPWTRLPARSSKRYRHYRDRPVYDETAQIDIPVAVDGAAAFGKYTLRLRLKTVLHNGDSGEVLAQFEDDIPCRLTVGRPLPSPVRQLVDPARRRAQAAPEAAVGERGLSLRALPPVRLRPGETHRFELRAEVPAGLHILRDGDLGVPRVGITGLGEGVRFELGPQPAVVAWAGQSIHEGPYTQQVTLVAAPTAPSGVRRASVLLQYALCDREARYPPAELAQEFDLEIADRAGAAAVVPVRRESAPAETGATGGAAGSFPGGDADPADPWAWVLGGLLAGLLGLGTLLLWRARR